MSIQQILHVKSHRQLGGHIDQIVNFVGSAVTEFISSTQSIIFSVIRAVKNRVGAGVLTKQNCVKSDHDFEGVSRVTLQGKQSTKHRQQMFEHVGIVKSESDMGLNQRTRRLP